MASTQPLLGASNVVATKDFFLSLGFKLINTWEPEGNLAWCLMEYENAPLMLEQHDKELVIGNADIHIYIVCEDIHPIRDKWVAKGIKVSKIHNAFYGMHQMFVRDPDGRTICFESAMDVT